MTKTVSVIGVEAGELRWIRTLVTLLRHPDPSVPDLARQALIYLTQSAADRSLDPAPPLTSAPLPGTGRISRRQ